MDGYRRQHDNAAIRIVMPAGSCGGQGEAGKQKVPDDLPIQLGNKGKFGDVIFRISDFFYQRNDVGSVGIIRPFPKGTKDQRNNAFIVLVFFWSNCDRAIHHFVFAP